MPRPFRTQHIVVMGGIFAYAVEIFTNLSYNIILNSYVHKSSPDWTNIEMKRTVRT